MIKVLVVEDSRVVRDYLVHALEVDPELEVIDAAVDGEHALQSVARRRPDVILMDIHLPGIDGLEATRRIMATTPIPIVICTGSTTFDQVKTAMQALEAGALACLRKPRGYGSPGAEAELANIIATLKLMAEIKVVRRWSKRSKRSGAPSIRSTAGEVSVITMGASTGGPPVLAEILSRLPSDLPVPILVAQHISSGFTAGFVEWLAQRSGLPGHLAVEGESPLPGHFYLPPDDYHMRVGSGRRLHLDHSDLHPGPRPSADLLFRSVAEHYGSGAVGVLLTGMGRDGAESLKYMASLGALTIAQDEASCVVFGMPAEAIKLGAAARVLAPLQIAELLLRSVGRIAQEEKVDV